MKSMSKWAGALCFGVVSMATWAAPADDYPSRSLRIVVPYPPGGFNDTLARTVGDRLSKRWKQSVVVDNRPGGNTVIGNSLVAKATPDGYTLLVTPLPFSALPALYGDRLPYHALRDFERVVWAASTQNAFVARNDLTMSTVRELLDYAKKNPGKLTYGSTGSGSSNHLSMELFQKMTGTKLTHIPYKGSAPAVVAILSGEIDLLFDNVPNVVSHIKAGKLKPVGVTGTARAAQLPQVPTVAEAGVPGYEVNVWFGMQAPAGTPTAIVGKLNGEIVKILREPDVVKLFRDQGVEVVASAPARFTQLVESEIAKWTAVVKEADIRIE